MWKNIQINIQNIDFETGKAILIKMPKNSDYAGYKFWHPSKLVRSGHNSYSVSIGYTDEFKFTLKKFGNGKYNKSKVIDEITIDAKEFEEAFGCMEDCTRERSSETYVNVEEPEKVEVENVEVVDELKNER